jgi:hypothetical protein
MDGTIVFVIVVLVMLFVGFVYDGCKPKRRR